MECGQVSFIPFELFGNARRGNLNLGTRGPFVYRFICLDKITETIHCNIGCILVSLQFYATVDSKWMALVGDSECSKRRLPLDRSYQ